MLFVTVNDIPNVGVFVLFCLLLLFLLHHLYLVWWEYIPVLFIGIMSMTDKKLNRFFFFSKSIYM